MNYENQFTTQRQAQEKKEEIVQYLNQLKKRKKIAMSGVVFFGLLAISALTKVPALIKVSGAPITLAYMGASCFAVLLMFLIVKHIDKQIAKLQRYIDEKF